MCRFGRKRTVKLFISALIMTLLVHCLSLMVLHRSVKNASGFNVSDSEGLHSDWHGNKAVTVSPQTHGLERSALNDFARYPCLSGLHTFHRDDQKHCVRTFNDATTDTQQIKKCVKLKTLLGTTPICVYDPKIDIWVSKYLQDKGEWEGDLVANMSVFLLSHPDVQFLGLGCNIGTYTLAIAHLGKTVTAIDPLIDNLKLLQHSLSLGHLQENVTLIWNAVSNTRSIIKLVKGSLNVGGTRIEDSALEDYELNHGGLAAMSILLDDLVPLYTRKRVAIKMDIEGSEYNALLGASDFFDMVDVPLVQMEFAQHKTRESGLKIWQFFQAKGYAPTADIGGKRHLDPITISNWPGDMYFFKMKIKLDQTRILTKY